MVNVNENGQMMGTESTGIFSDRISGVPRSFIREILKVAIDPSVISFAGGLPNRDLFPVEALKEATIKVFDSAGRDALQYTNSEGYIDLRAWIAERYRTQHGLDIPVDNILITTGSQQGLDLLGKTLINQGDHVVIEEPGYLGAIQAFSLYRPTWQPVTVADEGMDVDKFRAVMTSQKPKLVYTVPNFQNPGGITYSESCRLDMAAAIEGSTTLLIQDDPYGDLRFAGKPKSNFYQHLPNNTILLGTFSKIVAPALRIGWLVAPDAIMQKLIIAKQASDLHTDYLSQRIIHQYLLDNDVDDHIAEITRVYGRQRQAMVDAIEAHFPPDVRYTKPDGGMFLWVTLPEGLSSMALFDIAIGDKVAFVPGNPFYVRPHDANTLRLNYSCVDEATIEIGIKRLAAAIDELENSR